MLKGKSSLAALEADLTALVRRRAGLEKRRDEAAAVLLTVTAERRRLLVEHDNPPPAELAKAEKACREATDSRDAALDALGEVDNRMADLRARIAALKGAEGRDAQAKAIEATATRADAALLRIRKAAAEIEAARVELAAAILPAAAGCYAPNAISTVAADLAGRGGPGVLSTTFYGYDGRAVTSELMPDDIALRLAGHVVAAVLTGLSITTTEEACIIRGNGMPTPVLTPAPDAVAVEAVMVGPMRALAALIRSGDAATPTPAPAASLRVIREVAA